LTIKYSILFLQAMEFMDDCTFHYDEDALHHVNVNTTHHSTFQRNTYIAKAAVPMPNGPEKDKRDAALGYVTTAKGLMDMRYTANPIVLKEKLRRQKILN
jgi:hypothetical protein